MTWAVVFLLEGVSMGVLMGFHRVNFKTGSLFISSDKQPSYAVIKLGEYHRFATEEVDAHSLTDLSSRHEMTDGSKEAVSNRNSCSK